MGISRNLVLHDVTRAPQIASLFSNQSRLNTPNHAKSNLFIFPTNIIRAIIIKLALFRLLTESHAMSDRWLSVEEIAEYLGISKDTVYAWINKRNMPAHRIGRFWKFKSEEVDE